MDFIFGTLATDDLKLVHHRASTSGIQHRFGLQPRDPRPGDAVTLSVWTGTNFSAEHVACYYTTDGREPLGNRGSANYGAVQHFTPVETIWDNLSWGYSVRWEATLPPQKRGTFVRYRIGGWSAGDPEVFADYPDVRRISESASHAFFQNKTTVPDYTLGQEQPGAVFAYHVDEFATPEWVRDAVIYHLLVDRFYPGDGKDWWQTDNLSVYCGGTLGGVQDKLSYLQDLGINCIWLSPTFESPTYHGYDTTDFRKTEARYGGDVALRSLIDAAHRRGMRVLLDMACNHLSDQHPLFQQSLHDSTSRARSHFTFDNSELGYGAFFGVASMPQVNLTDDAARDWMVENGRYWLREYDVDGYRLDYANGPGPNFWTYFNAACKDQKPDCYCFGEIIDAPEVQQRYIGRLDGCLDFYVNESIRKAFAWRTQSVDDLARAIDRHSQFFPDTFVMPSFLDNHDMDRFLHVAQGDTSALKEAFTFQLTLRNPPVIYYGTEVGLSHKTSAREGGLEVGRLPMPWDHTQDTSLLSFFADAICARTSHKAGELT
ncbi:MAG: alpha-amylase family glycosyl hydrolase [Chloroflexota bacterium]|nr:alpha-amylase family glycosyl hydrolase [Chloroflexota bacterium]